MDDNNLRTGRQQLISVIGCFSALCILGCLTAAIFGGAFFKPHSRLQLAAAFLLTALAAALMGFDRRGVFSLIDGLARPGLRRPRTALLGLMLISTVVALATAGWVLDRFANSADEYAYVLQAKTYASGRLWVEAPPLPEAFQMYRFLAKDGLWLSQYPPGWAAGLAIFEVLGVPLVVVDPLLAAATVFAFFSLAKMELSPRAAWLASLTLVCGAFFVLTYASYLSHGVAALAGLASIAFATHYLKSGKAIAALLAGVCLGYLGFTRPFNAVIFAVPIAVALLLTPGRRVGHLLVAAGGLPFLLALLAYNQAITGNPLVMRATWLQPGGEPLGAPSAAYIVENIKRAGLLHLWSSPLLPLGWVAAFFLLAKRRRLGLADWIAPATFIAFIFYGGDSGNHYGPRYYFEAWPFMLFTLFKAFDLVFFQEARKSSRVGPERLC